MTPRPRFTSLCPWSLKVGCLHESPFNIETVPRHLISKLITVYPGTGCGWFHSLGHFVVGSRSQLARSQVSSHTLNSLSYVGNTALTRLGGLGSCGPAKRNATPRHACSTYYCSLYELQVLSVGMVETFGFHRESPTSSLQVAHLARAARRPID